MCEDDVIKLLCAQTLWLLVMDQSNFNFNFKWGEENEFGIFSFMRTIPFSGHGNGVIARDRDDYRERKGEEEGAIVALTTTKSDLLRGTDDS